MRPVDFWQLTYAEFWPMYNAVMGNVVPPLDESDLEDLEAAWLGGTNGNS